jgi:lipopolysaccharide/colanic/teichoic acid biosynthesis glycosyltransferase
MPHPALQRWGAELAQPWPAPVPAPQELSLAQREAERLGKLAASFCLFGLRIDLDDTALAVDSAEPYRSETAPAARPANDARPAPPDATLSTVARPERRGPLISPALPIRLLQGVDWVLAAAAAQFAALWGAQAGLGQMPIGDAAAFILSAGALKAGLWLTETYRISPARMRIEHGVGGLALGVVLGLGLAAVLAPDARSTAALVITLPLAALLLAGAHAAFAVWIAAAHRAGMFSETVVLVGATDAARRLAQRAGKSGEARIAAIFDDRVSRSPTRLANVPVTGALEDLVGWDRLPDVDRIIITLPQKADVRLRAIIERLSALPNRVDLLLDYDAHTVRGRGAERFTGVAIACVSGRPHNHGRALAKNTLDLALGSALLTVFALPMLAIALAIRLESKGPALVRQRSLGLNNRIFDMLKFRVARLGEGKSEPTRLAGFLRRTRLDDLPQLLNVLRGEMSVIGPRPHAVDAMVSGRELARVTAEYAHRHRVKPGIVGWAHVNGAHGPLKSAAALRRRLRLDLDYVARASLWLDLHILARLTLDALKRGGAPPAREQRPR